MDQGAQCRVHLEDFKDADAPTVAGAVAIRASRSARKHYAGWAIRRAAQSAPLRGVGHIGFATGAAHATDEALRHDSAQSRRDEVRLGPEIDEPAHGADGVVGVQRRTDQVTGEGGLQRDLGGFAVADFADHHDVRRLAQHRAQGRSKRETHGRPHRDLVDAAQLTLDGVLNGEDLAVSLV